MPTRFIPYAPSALLLALAATAGAATAPLAVDDTVAVSAGAETAINVLANDSPGTAVISASTPAHGRVILENGRVRYIPNAGFVGSDSFTYVIRDAMTVGAVDRAPLASFGSGAGAVPVMGSGYGSALARVPGSDTDFYIMTDRGPNTAGTPSTNKVFPIPAFAPQLARVTPNGGSSGGYRVVSVITFKRPTAAPANAFGGRTLTGLPFTANPTSGNAVAAGGAAIIGSGGAVVTGDDYGIDSEGLVALADGSFWVSDEHGPMLSHFAADGVELERVTPSGMTTPTLTDQSLHSLPRVLRKRFENKGMEGLTITPDGSKLVGIMQSALNNLPITAPATASDANGAALRIVVYDLATGATKQYVYLLERTASASLKTAVSEISAISNTKFLIVERDGKFPNDPAGASVFKRIYEIDLAGDPRLGASRIAASDVSDAGDSDSGTLYAGGKTLEDLTYGKTSAEALIVLAAAGVQPVFKRPVLDLLTLGNGYAYNHDKVEGLAVLSTALDPIYGTVAARIGIANDDDFGVTDGAANLPAAKLTPQGLTDYNEILTLDLTRQGPGVTASYRHVLVLTIDGFRDADLVDANLAADLPNLTALKSAGIRYSNAACDIPTDSFPGLLGIMTGASPKTTGVYFDESYSRTLFPSLNEISAGAASVPGARVPWTEAITKDSSKLNGIDAQGPVAPLAATGYDASAIDPGKLPQRSVAGVLTPFYPHQYLKVNTIFEVAHAAGLRSVVGQASLV